MARRKVRSELRPLNAAYLVRNEAAASIDEWWHAYHYLFAQDSRWWFGLELTAPRFKNGQPVFKPNKRHKGYQQIENPTEPDAVFVLVPREKQRRTAKGAAA